MSLSITSSFLRATRSVSSLNTSGKSASKHAQRAYSTKKLAGSKTHQNLKDAFAGESMVCLSPIATSIRHFFAISRSSET